MKMFIQILLITLFSQSTIAKELGGGSYELQDGSSVKLSEKEYKCLQARRSLENIFSEESEGLNKPFEEVKDAIQAYKKLDCVFTAGFLFTHPKQVDKYFRYKMQSSSLRAPASVD